MMRLIIYTLVLVAFVASANNAYSSSILYQGDKVYNNMAIGSSSASATVTLSITIPPNYSDLQKFNIEKVKSNKNNFEIKVESNGNYEYPEKIDFINKDEQVISANIKLKDSKLVTELNKQSTKGIFEGKLTLSKAFM